MKHKYNIPTTYLFINTYGYNILCSIVLITSVIFYINYYMIKYIIILQLRKKRNIILQNRSKYKVNN